MIGTWLLRTAQCIAGDFAELVSEKSEAGMCGRRRLSVSGQKSSQLLNVNASTLGAA